MLALPLLPAETVGAKEYAPDQVPVGDQQEGKNEPSTEAVHILMARAVERGLSAQTKMRWVLAM